MKLYMCEHDEQGIWYFTNLNKAAKYIGTSMTNLQHVVKKEFKQFKGWTIEEIDDDNIISRFINPEK